MSTKATIRTNVAKILGDGAFAIWPSAEIDRYTQDGYDLLVTSVGCLVKILDMDDTINVGTVTLPADFDQLERAAWKKIKIFAVDPIKLQYEDPGWLTRTGDVLGYIFDGDGPGTLRKWRVPAVSAVGRFRLEYRRRGATLSADGTALELPERYAKYVQFYALYRCLNRDGEGQDVEWADHWKMRFDLGVARMKARMAKARSARRGTFGEPHVRRGRPPKPQLPWNFPRR